MKTSYQVLAVVMVGATVILMAMAHLGGSRPSVTAPSRMGSAVERPVTLVVGRNANWLAFATLPCETCFRPADLAPGRAFAGPGNPAPLVAADDPFAADLRAGPYASVGAPLADPAPQITAGAMMAFGAVLTLRGRRRSGVNAWTAPWRTVAPDA